MTIVCAYFGRPDECTECGGQVRRPGERVDRFCSDDCAADYTQRAAAQDTAVAARRAAEDAFGREVDRLRAAGHSDERIDVLLAGMP